MYVYIYIYVCMYVCMSNLQVAERARGTPSAS